MFSKVDVVLKTNNSLRVQVGVSCIIGIYRWGGCVNAHWCTSHFNYWWSNAWDCLHTPLLQAVISPPAPPAPPAGKEGKNVA